jgi:hypothetical protein
VLWTKKVRSVCLFVVLFSTVCCVPGYPNCWGEKAPHQIDPPRITYREFLQSRENSGWLIKQVKDEYEGDDEEEEETSNDGILPNGQEDSNYIQFRQIAVGESLSCGITLMGSHLVCWGDPRVFYKTDLPKQVKGPFRQVSVGAAGVCAIRGESEDGTDQKQLPSSFPDEFLPDSLQCWGVAKNMIKQDHFIAWDQISVGSNYICGVSMESEVECGGVIPGTDHKDIIIA